MELSEKIQKLRKEHNMTQEQFAEKLFVSRTAVSKWETGISAPDLSMILPLSSNLTTSYGPQFSKNKALAGVMYWLRLRYLLLAIFLINSFNSSTFRTAASHISSICSPVNFKWSDMDVFFTVRSICAKALSQKPQVKKAASTMLAMRFISFLFFGGGDVGNVRRSLSIIRGG